MWDKKDKFYYNFLIADNSFEFKGASLKRKELINHLTSEKSFWQKYGILTLVADDPNYMPFMEGFCGITW